MRSRRLGLLPAASGEGRRQDSDQGMYMGLRVSRAKVSRWMPGSADAPNCSCSSYGQATAISGSTISSTVGREIQVVVFR